MRAKFYYATLTQTDHEQVGYNNAYTLLKAQCENISRKPGFLSIKEVPALCAKYNIPKSTLYKRLSMLVSAGYIRKTKFGYILTSTRFVNPNLNNITPSKAKRTGRHYYPCASISIPETNDLRILELVRMYLLLCQIRNRKSEMNGRYVTNSKHKKSNVPEKIKIALEYLRLNGKYNSKITVNNLLEDLQNVNLLKISKGKFNTDSLWYDTNEYTILPFKNAVWSNLYKPTNRDLFLKSLQDIKPAKRIKKASTTAKKPAKSTLTPIEQKFIDFLEVGKSVLVVNGFIPYAYLNKKIRKNMIPNVLNKILSDDGMKKIFLSQFTLDNVRLNVTKKVTYNPYAFSYERYSDEYYEDRVVLVSNGGNYTGRLLTTHQSRLASAIESRKYRNMNTSHI